MDLGALKGKLTEVNGYLRSNSFGPLAEELEALLIKVESGDSKAVQEIKKRCHVKWMGDIPIKEIEFNEWVELLESIKELIDSGEQI